MPACQLKQLLLAFVTLATLSSGTFAQYQRPDVGSMDKVVSPIAEGEVAVDESKLNTFVPKDLAFNDEDGNPVTIGSYLDKGRPIILWIGYFECPMLCDRMSGGMVRAVRSMKLDGATEYAILNVSVNPDEVPGIAKQKKENYLKELGQPGQAAGWNLLTGSPAAIEGLTESVGYKYKAVEIAGETEYAHPAVLIILSPEGQVSRYLYPDQESAGVEFSPQTMRLSLIEASQGRVGSTIDRFLLTCLRFDQHTGKYTKNVQAIMRYAGGATVLLMAAVFVPLWVRSARNSTKGHAAFGANDSPA
jgi:protein SCO1